MTVTTLGKRSLTTPTISSSAVAFEAAGALATGRPMLIGADWPRPPLRRSGFRGGCGQSGPPREGDKEAVRSAPHSLPARNPRCFGVRAGRGLAAPRGRTHSIGFDHLTDR